MSQDQDQTQNNVPGSGPEGSALEQGRREVQAPRKKPKTSLPPIPQTPLKNKYEFLSVIGAGGAGVIYKARQMPLGRLVAVKMIHSHVMSDVAVKRFQQEAKTISTLSHPNIISVYDFGLSEDNQPFMIMDYVEGTPLSDIVDEMEKLPPDLVRNIACQICDGLAHAHRHGFLHRDLKPSNVMIVTLETGAKVVKILDFGLAKLLFGEEENEEHLTKAGETVGTPAFMSPEQVMGKGMDQRSDIYSLGCLMYHCLSGDPPFVGETKMETMLMQLNNKPAPINEDEDDPLVPPALEKIVLQLLEKSPAARFQDMLTLKTALESYDRKLFDSSTREETQEKENEEEDIESETREDQKRRNLVIAICIVAVAITSSAYLVLFQLGFFNQQYANMKKVDDGDGPGQPELSKKKKKKKKDPFYSDAYVDDQFLGLVERRKRERSVDSEGAAISDKSLEALHQVRHLEKLILKGSPITDAGLLYLKGLPISDLNLEKTRISDDGMQTLVALKELQKLYVSDTEIGDRGIDRKSVV